MTTFAFNWHLECVCVCVCVCVLGDGTDNLVGLNPHPVESDAISGQTVSELIKLWDTHLVSFLLWRKPSTHLVTKVSEMKCPVWARKKTHREETHGGKNDFFYYQVPARRPLPGDLSGSNIPPTSPSCYLLLLLHGTFWDTCLLSSLLCGLLAPQWLSKVQFHPFPLFQTSILELRLSLVQNQKRISTTKTNICFKNTCMGFPWWSSG